MFATTSGARPPAVRPIFNRLLGTSALLMAFLAPAAIALPNNGIRGSTLPGEQTLRVGEALVSPNSEFFLATQADGSLCVARETNGQRVWCSRTASPEDQYFTTMRSNGKLCTTSSAGVELWCSSNAGSATSSVFVSVQDNANLCIYQGTPARILSTLWCSNATATVTSHGAQLRYGQAYGLQNGYRNWTGGYLDTRGNSCEGNALCVSTASVTNRDRGSGQWIVASVEGKPNGALVRPGDKVYLKNRYPFGADDLPPYAVFGGYLDVRSGGCEGNVLCVSTSLQHNRDSGSGTWTIVAPRHTVYVLEPIELLNSYVLVESANAFLDTRASGCESNLLCVSGSYSPNRDSGSGLWRFR